MRLDVTFAEQEEHFDVVFEESDHEVNADFSNVQVVTDADPYEGEYVITPSTTKQVLPTRGKVMADDVMVLELETDETLKLENGILSVNTTNDMEQDNTLPITSAGVYTAVGNIEVLLKTI